ncbi:hypothetical protein HID58_052398, partial [Brassica napus]
ISKQLYVNDIQWLPFLSSSSSSSSPLVLLNPTMSCLSELNRTEKQTQLKRLWLFGKPLVPRLVQSLNFDGSKCKPKPVTFRIDGSLVAPADYRVIGNEDYWIFFQHLDGVTVYGGVLDAQGTSLWDCKKSGKNCPSGATTIGFQSASNVVVSGLTSLNSQMFHVVINGCNNVKLQGVKVLAAGNSPNTDGIHVQSSSTVSIFNTKISTGDDCVSIGPGTNGLWIENVACGPGHGISIGSLGKDSVEEGVQNVTVKTVAFTGTDNGVRIKSWARPSSGFARNIRFQHCVMNNVGNPILIDQNYCPRNENCPRQVSGIKISDVLFVDIHGTSATEVGVKLDCTKPIPTTFINVLTYGAKPDGSTDSTKAFLAAWQVACASVNPTTIIVPKGRFLVGNLVFQGKKCTDTPISIRIAGSLIAPEDYRIVASSEQWIWFESVTDVSIYGGILDAQGSGLWNCKNNGGSNCPTGAKTLLFSGSNNININGLTSINSQKFHIVINSCNNVNIDGVKVSADANSPNTDGIHIQSSHLVSITNSRIGTGDDCISIGPGSTHVSIQGIQCGPGHGISIGSLGIAEEEQGVENVTVSNVDFTATSNGVRIKTWAKNSKSFARNIVFQHINMKMVKNPIIIDQRYCFYKPCPEQESGVEVSNVRYEDIHGTSSTDVAVKLDCSKEKPCTGIVMDNVNLALQLVNQPAQASCSNANGLANDVVIPFTPCLKRDILMT